MNVAAVEHMPVYLRNYLQTNTKQEYFILSNPVLKDNKIVSHFSQAQQYVLFIFILTTCFGESTIIRPALQTLGSGACSVNSIHVILDSHKTYKYI